MKDVLPIFMVLFLGCAIGVFLAIAQDIKERRENDRILQLEQRQDALEKWLGYKP